MNTLKIPRCMATTALPFLAAALLTPSALAQWESLHGARAVIGQADFEGTSYSLSQTRLDNPNDIAIDPNTGKIFVADGDNTRVLRFASAAAMACGAPAEAVFGQPDFESEDGAATAEGLGYPNGITIDSAGNLWVADGGFHRVLRYGGASTKPSGSAADQVLGQANFTDNDANRDGTVDDDTMSSPFDVAVEPDGTVWVADSGNHRVLRFNNAIGKGDGGAADGVLGQVNLATAVNPSGPSISNTEYPLSLAVETDGTLWVTTNDRRILRFDSAKTKSGAVDANGVLGQPDFDTGSGGLTADKLTDPEGIGVDDAGTLWVCDSDKNRVLRFENAKAKMNGDPAEGVLGQEDFVSDISAAGQFRLDRPGGVAIAPTGEVLIVETGNNRVTVFEPGNPTPDPCPGAMEDDWSDGRDAASQLGQDDFDSGTENRGEAMTVSNGFDDPSGLAVDPATGKVFVADSENNRVLRFSSVAKLLNGTSPEAVLGQADFESSDAAAGKAGMRKPTGLEIDSAGRLWVADQLNHRVLRFDGAATKPTGADADGVLGQPNFDTTTDDTSQGKLDQPADVAIDGDGNLWIADFANDRVIRFASPATLPAGSFAQQVLGQGTFTTSGTSNAANGMSGPQGVAVDDMGRLWVADSGNSRVLRFDGAAGSGDGDNADGVLGKSGFGPVGGGAESARMVTPRGIAAEMINGIVRLWVADSGNHRVIWFDDAGAKANGDEADGVLGQRDLFADSMGTSRTTMNTPTHVAAGTSGRLWVCDAGNHRVLRFNPGGFQVDGWIGTRRNSQKGNNKYNLGAGQKVTDKSKNRKKLKFFARFENDGPSDDTFTVKGTRKNRNFRIKYFDLTGGRKNVTAAVTRGTYSLVDVIADTDREIQAEVKPKRKTKDKKKNRTLKIKGTSAEGGTVDQVKAKAQTLK